MKIVKEHGRKPDYDFEKDERLANIKNGDYGAKAKPTKYHVTCAIDSFLTIWLVTLPEKFKQWYDYHNSGIKQNVANTLYMDLNQEPMFPFFIKESDSTKISKTFGTYDFLPPTWNLPAAFKYYLQQKELWNTKSIDDELAAYNNVKSSKRKSRKKEEVVFSNNAEEEYSEEQQSVKQDDDKEQEADDFEDDLALNLTFNESNMDENNGLGIGTPKSTSRTRSLPASYSDQHSSSTKKQRVVKKQVEEGQPELNQVTKSEAANLIMELSSALGRCNILMDESMLYTMVQDLQDKIFQIQMKMTNIMRIKDCLVQFAMENSDTNLSAMI
jgi:hypothetical protein